MSHFRRKFASYAVSESAIFSEPLGLSGSNFQNKLVLMIPTSGKNFKKIWEVGLNFSKKLDDLIWNDPFNRNIQVKSHISKSHGNTHYFDISNFDISYGLC